ncbi:MAG TPA: porin [Candidatus Binataceae bacterium]|nr:porin [Candidatus Binataceae bacterium]
MRKKYLSAAMVAAGFLALPISTAHADEVSDLKAEAKALQKQNDALAKRLAAIEKRQKAIETDTTATQRIMNARATDMPMPYKAAAGAAPVDDALCWKRVCLYGIIDAGFGWQSHGQPFNGAFPTGAQYLVSAGSNRALWTAAPNGLSQSTIGLKGAVEVLPDLDAIFKVETGFNPEAGQLANGEGSMVQNNGIPLNLRSANGDSSRNGQALNGQAYVGVQSPLWGTLTVGRNNGLPLDQILAYDAMGGAYAFSPIGFSGTWAGGGSTEDGRLDQSIKYNWNYGLLHGGVLYQVGNYDGAEWVHDDVQGDLGLIYQGFSIDGTASKIRGMVSASPLAPSPANIGVTGLAGTISDNVEWMVTAKYKWDAFEVMGGYEHIDFANPSNPVPADFVNNYGYQFVTVSNAAFPMDKILQMSWIGGKWKATDHLTLIASYYHETQNAFGIASVIAGCNTALSSMCSGTLDAVSFVADYVFTKHFDVYGGVMYSQMTNGLANGSVQTSILSATGAAIGNNGKSTASNIDPTIGARYSF